MLQQMRLARSCCWIPSLCVQQLASLSLSRILQSRFQSTSSSHLYLSSSMPNFVEVSLEDYLQTTIGAIDPDYKMTVNESHRKTMVAVLLGIKLVDFNQELRDLHSKIQWEKTLDFVANEIATTFPDDQEIPDALEFRKGMQSVDSFRENASKFFSFLARGRTYKGKFEELLKAEAPHLLPVYEGIVQEIPQRDLIKVYVNDVAETDLKEPILQCVEMSFPQAPRQPADGGKASGLKGEMDMSTFLNDRWANDPSMIRSGVLLKPNRKNKKSADSIIVSEHALRERLTSEFDSMIVKIDEEDASSIHIVELWEAKASLHPASISDVLFKKAKSLQMILGDSDAQFHFHEQQYSLKDTFPKVGIFGTTLLNPRSSARRAQMLACEEILGSSVDAVLEAIATGNVTPVDVESRLKFILDEVIRIKPVLVTPSYGNDDEQRTTI
jgi:hypothetical protein